MPDRKTNVLSQLLCAWRYRKAPCRDIVEAADLIIEEYIHTKTRLIHRRCRRNNGSFLILSLIFASAAGLGFILFSMI